MKYLLAILFLIFLGSCSGRYHTVKVKKPIYHHTWYKNSRWHNKIHVGRVRLKIFERQGVKTVRMKG